MVRYLTQTIESSRLISNEQLLLLPLPYPAEDYIRHALESVGILSLLVLVNVALYNGFYRHGFDSV